MSSTAAEQDERRRRRRVFLFLAAGLIAALVLASVGLFSLDQRGGARSGALDGGGSGTAPVLADPPVDVERTASPAATSSSRTDPSRQELIDAREGGSLVAPAPGATKGAALGAPRTHGVNLVLTSKLSEPLRPGFERTLYVTVRNPNPFPVDLFRIDVRVDEPPAAGCLADWVRVGHYRYGGGTPRRVSGGTSAVVNLPIEMVNLVDVDQNACQNTYFPLRLSGVAVDVE